MSRAHTLFALTALSLTLLSSLPLFIEAPHAADICCNSSEDCPESFGCVVDGQPCGPTMRGQCLWIDDGSRHTPVPPPQ